MKIKAGQAIFATLDLVMEMAAKQRAFQQVMIKILCADDEDEYKEMLSFLNQQSNKELELIRAKILQYSEIDETNLLNGLFDV